MCCRGSRSGASGAPLIHDQEIGRIQPSIDNSIYDRLAAGWWEEDGVLAPLRILLNPARFGYFQRVLTATLGRSPAGMEALDVGCGGGFLAEEFTALGCRVTGVDPSGPTIEAARTHAALSGLDIAYVQAAGEDLPFPDNSFDLVYCCDVLEHVRDLDRVITESARVLRPGGMYLYDTINRTLRSKLAVINLLQRWEMTSVMPTGFHNWKLFIKPSELIAALERHGIENCEIRGMKPEAGPLRFLTMLVRLKRGELERVDLARRGGRFVETRDVSISYMGYGIKR